MADFTGRPEGAIAEKRKKRTGQSGSASVEFAAVLPLVAIAMLVVVQVSLVVWDQMRVAHAAREGARVLAVTNEAGAVKEAVTRAGDFDPERVVIEIGPADRPAGTSASVTVRFRPSVVVPFVGRFAPGRALHSTAWIRVERDPP